MQQGQSSLDFEAARGPLPACRTYLYPDTVVLLWSAVVSLYLSVHVTRLCHFLKMMQCRQHKMNPAPSMQVTVPVKKHKALALSAPSVKCVVGTAYRFESILLVNLTHEDPCSAEQSTILCLPNPAIPLYRGGLCRHGVTAVASRHLKHGRCRAAEQVSELIVRMQVQAISVQSVQTPLGPSNGPNFKAFRKVWPQGHSAVRPQIGYAPAAYSDTAVDAEAFLRSALPCIHVNMQPLQCCQSDLYGPSGEACLTRKHGQEPWNSLEPRWCWALKRASVLIFTDRLGGKDTGSHHSQH